MNQPFLASAAPDIQEEAMRSGRGTAGLPLSAKLANADVARVASEVTDLLRTSHRLA